MLHLETAYAVVDTAALLICAGGAAYVALMAVGAAADLAKWAGRKLCA